MLTQGDELFATLGISSSAKLAVAVVVSIVASGVSYTVEGWLTRSERS